MKYLLLALTIVLFACNNHSSQSAIYKDSARMYLDSMRKYAPVPIVNDETMRKYNDSGEIRHQLYNIYSTLREYYLEKAKN